MMLGPTRYSPEAEVAMREAAHRAERAEEIRAIMRRGPRIDGDLVIIPSVRYHADAPSVYAEGGFVYDPARKEWTRLVTLPLRGRIYSAAGWLAAARRLYRQVWPDWCPPECPHQGAWGEDEWDVYIRGGDVVSYSIAKARRERTRRLADCVCRGQHWFYRARVPEPGDGWHHWTPCPICNAGGRNWTTPPPSAVEEAK